MPFVSKAQWRYMFKFHPEIAHEMARKTPGGPIVRYRRLPGHKGLRGKIRASMKGKAGRS